MATNRQLNQFFFSPTRNLSALLGSVSLAPQAKAELEDYQGIDFTAKAFGASGNSITITFTGGATAGAEVVTVVGSEISVQIQTGVSTIDDVIAAIEASAPADALVDVAINGGASGSDTVVVTATDSLEGGVSGVQSYNIQGISNIVQSDVGEFTITLTDLWNQLMVPRFTIMSATAQDLIVQVRSVDLPNKTIIFRTLAGATPTSPTSNATLWVKLLFKNSSVRY